MLALGLVAPAAAGAQTMSAGVVIGVEDDARVTRAGAPSSMRLRVKDTAYVGDRLETGDQSRLRLLLGGKALLTLHERTVVTLTEAPNVGTIELMAGKVFLNVVRERLKVGEAIAVRTLDAIARIRGTAVVAEVSEAAATDAGAPSGLASRFTVMTGIVGVSPFDADGQAAAAIRLDAGETIVISKGRPPVQPRRLPSDDLSSLVAGFIKTAPDLPTSVPRARLTPKAARPVSPPTDWTLLIDRGNGFELWWGAAGDGDVAGDQTLERTSLATCDAVARPLAHDGVRVACARLKWRESRRPTRHRDTDDRLLARGPLAGKLVVYEPGADAPGWRLIPRLGGWGRSVQRWRLDRPDVLSGADVELSTCYEASMRLLEDHHESAACVRLSPSNATADYRDSRGRLMVEGPFAGDFIVHDPAPPPTSP